MTDCNKSVFSLKPASVRRVAARLNCAMGKLEIKSYPFVISKFINSSRDTRSVFAFVKNCFAYVEKILLRAISHPFKA